MVYDPNAEGGVASAKGSSEESSDMLLYIIIAAAVVLVLIVLVVTRCVIQSLSASLYNTPYAWLHT